MPRLSIYINDDFYDSLIDLRGRLQKKRRREINMSEIIYHLSKRSMNDSGVYDELLKAIH